MSKIIETIKITLISILCIFLMMVIVQRLLPGVRSFFGFRSFVIVSKSMEPILKVGDVILVQTKKAEDIKINDIVTYQGGPGDFSKMIITHQVQNIKTENKRLIFYTKGAANDMIDPAVYQEQIYGVLVYKFVILSMISKVIRNTFGLMIFVIVPLGILFVTEVKEIRSELKERR